MTWQKQLKGDSLTWLLEAGPPGVRYLALRDLLDAPAGDRQLVSAREAVTTQGPAATILSAMHAKGYWVKPGPGYTQRYRSTVWSLIALSQLGARVDMDERIGRACGYLLDHALTGGGQFGVKGTPETTVDCLQGNLCAALLDLGCQDPRLEAAYDWMARSVTGEDVASADDLQTAVRYYPWKCGPLFTCRFNGMLPCAWGAVKVMLALGKLPAGQRTPLIERAIQAGADFLLSVDPASARYPTRRGARPNPTWWKFGFPVFYVTDLLQNIEVLVGLGYGKDARLRPALDLVLGKQDSQGRWKMESGYAGKVWGDYGVLDQPNPWVTLRALRVLKEVG